MFQNNFNCCYNRKCQEFLVEESEKEIQKKSKCLDRERVLREAPNAKTKTIFMKNIMLPRRSNTLIPKHIDLIGEAEL